MKNATHTYDLEKREEVTKHGVASELTVTLLRNGTYVDVTEHDFYTKAYESLAIRYIDVFTKLLPPRHKIMIRLANVTNVHKKQLVRLLNRNWWDKSVCLHYHNWRNSRDVTEEIMCIFYECERSNFRRNLEKFWFSIGHEARCHVLIVKDEHIPNLLKSVMASSSKTIKSLLLRNSVIMFDNFENGINFGVSTLTETGANIIDELRSCWPHEIGDMIDE